MILRRFVKWSFAMKMTMIFTAIAATWFGLYAKAQAQVVLGPGYIEVPYVRIQWNAGGGIHIQAPFVDINTCPINCPPCGSTNVSKVAPPVVHPVPTPQTLAEQLFSAGRELNRSLDRFDTAATWQHYFGLARGEPLATVPVEHLPGQYMYPSANAADVVGLRRHFDLVSQDDRYRMIANLPAFQKTHQLLVAFLNERSHPPGRAAEELPEPGDPTIQDDRPRPQD
jgi:hypothetical protein